MAKAAGKSRGKRVLNDEQVLDIFKTYQPRVVTMKMLAEKFKVSVSTIQAITTGRTYKWLTGLGMDASLAAA
jgi:hypothetical protein